MKKEKKDQEQKGEKEKDDEEINKKFRIGGGSPG